MTALDEMKSFLQLCLSLFLTHSYAFPLYLFSSLSPSLSLILCYSLSLFLDPSLTLFLDPRTCSPSLSL